MQNLAKNSDFDGIYTGMPAREYHAADGLNSGKVNAFIQSPRKYKHFFVDDNEAVDLPAWAFGRLVHGMYLEPDTFLRQVHIVDAASRRGKAWTEALEENPDKEVVLISDIEKAAGVVHSLRQDRDACQLLEGAVFETSLFWNEDGRLAKARPDIWQQHLRVVTDLKTCGDASPGAFMRSIFRYGYHISAAWYRRGVEAITGEELRQWYWIAVEKEPPYNVQVHFADAAVLAAGDYEIDAALARLDECTATNKWPAYKDGINVIELPAWYEMDEELTGATER